MFCLSAVDLAVEPIHDSVMDYITFEPIYKERVWGGRRLESSLGRSLPGTGPIGESWEIVDRSDDQSVIANGEFQGQAIREALSNASGQIMGPNWNKARPFPILLKWLDCTDRLSLQVHPPKAVADELGGESKTENWYVAETEPGASLIVGIKHGISRSDFENALKTNDLEKCVHKLEVNVGDSIFVPSGRLHAIDKGNLILEIQENSDTTYRVYDWGRVGLDGKPRELHIEQSLKSIDFDDFEPRKTQQNDGLLVDSDIFRLRQTVLSKGQTLEFNTGEEPRIISVVEGKIKASGSETSSVFERGANLLLPFGGSFSLEGVEKSSKILITDRFNR